MSSQENTFKSRSNVKNLSNYVFRSVAQSITEQLMLELPSLFQSSLAEMRGHIDARTSEVQASQHDAFRQVLKDELNVIAGQLRDYTQATNDQFMQEMHRQLAHVDAHLSAHLSKELSLFLGERGVPLAAGPGPAQIQQRLLTLGRLLEPSCVADVAKRRLGRWSDGGYVMIDDFKDAKFALSFGVGAEMSWDTSIAECGLEVHQFDHTIEAPPEKHELIHFHRSRIGSLQDGAEYSLGSAQILVNNQPLIVKMDIEGDEWNVLDSADDNDFSQITQMIVEFHDFDRASDVGWFQRSERVLRRLGDLFQIVHVHANNYGALMVRGNISFPEIIEVTFAKKNLYNFKNCTEIFPTLLDAPNREDVPDIILGAFRFPFKLDFS